MATHHRHVLVALATALAACETDPVALDGAAQSDDSADTAEHADMADVTAAPCLSASPSIVDFGVKVLGSASSIQADLLACGDTPVVVTGVTLASDADAPIWLSEVPPMPLMLAPGEAATFYVNYEPTTAANATATIAIASNASDSPTEVAVRGYALGDAASTCTGPTITIAEGESVPSGTRIHLTGTGGVTDPAVVTTYAWSLDTSHASIAPFLPSASSATPTLATYALGDYLFRLSITDAWVDVPVPLIVADDVVHVVAGESVALFASDNDDGVVSGIPSTWPSHGDVFVTTDGAFYQPAEGFVGTDSYTYEACDAAGACATATVTIIVDAGPNHFPLARRDRYEAAEGAPQVLDVLANDSDADGDALTIVDVIQPAHGTVAIVEGGTRLAVSPGPDIRQYDRILYTVSDGHGGTATTVANIVYALPTCPSAERGMRVTPPVSP